MKTKTTKDHYEKYARMTGGEAREPLKKIVLSMINNDVDMLKELFEKDEHLNNIDKVLRKHGNLKQKSELKQSLDRWMDYGVHRSKVKRYYEGPYVTPWFATFDYYIPEFWAYTKENRKDMGGLGLSNACVCSGFKHIMIYDILGIEPDFEE